MIKYGGAPKVFRECFVTPEYESMCYLYMPVFMPGDLSLALEPRLNVFRPLIEKAYNDALTESPYAAPNWRRMGCYVYLTVKCLWVTPDSPGNRPGWHADGYASNGDLNYIWCDKNPTEFAIQDNLQIPADDKLSMIEFERQIRPESIVTYPACHLIRLDESIIHRVGPVVETGFRTFVKITISQHKFCNAGNTRNYKLDYNWTMQPRCCDRNLDAKV